MLRHVESKSWVTPTSCSHVAASAPKILHRYVTGKTTSTYTLQVVLLVWPSNQWHWLVACRPHTTQPTRQSLPPQGNDHLPAVESPGSEPASLAKYIALYSIMTSTSNSNTQSAVGVPSLNLYLSPYTIPKFTHYCM